MATVRVNGFELLEGQLARMGRPMIKQIVEAGSSAAEKRMAERTENAGHGSPGRSRSRKGKKHLQAREAHSLLPEKARKKTAYPSGCGWSLV